MGYYIFVLLFLYFWWTRYNSSDVTVDELGWFSMYLVLDVFIHTILVWLVIFLVLLFHNFMQPKGLTLVPSVLCYAFFFFFYTFFSAFICFVITSVYISHCVDRERLRVDPGFSYVVVQCVMLANLIMYFVIFLLLTRT